MGLQEEKTIFLRLLLRRLLKRQLYRTFIAFLILEGRPEGPDRGEFVCVLDEAAVFKSRWPMMSLEKTLKRATRKNFFMAPCVMFPYAGLEVGRKRNWKTFVLPICHSGL